MRGWLRQGWFWGAWVAVGLQYVGFWLISPEVGERWRGRPPGKPSAPSARAGASDFSELIWLWTPSLSLSSGRDDFSAEAWMKPETTTVPVEAFPISRHALPFLSGRAPDTAEGDSRSLGQRVEPPLRASPGSWTDAVFPRLEPVRIDPAVRVRVADGAAGWRLAPGVAAGAFPADPATTISVAVRVVLDARGGLVAPPLVWEGSGNPAVDASALDWTRRLKWVRDEAAVRGAEAESGTAERVWALVVFEWGGRTGG